LLILIITSGPDKGRVDEAHDDQPIVVGRDGEVVRLSDRRALRQHARLLCVGGRWYVEDLDSRHGTYRNQKRIETRTALKYGDYLQVGRTVLVVARLSVENVEHRAMLASPGSGQSDGVVYPVRSARSSRGAQWGVAGILAAALAIVAVNLYQFVLTTDVRADLASVQMQTEQTKEEVLVAVEALGGNDDEPLLKEILASIENQASLRPLIEDVRQTIANQPLALQPQMETMLGQIMSDSRKQADILAALSGLQEQIKTGATMAQINQHRVAAVHDQLARQEETTLNADVASLSQSISKLVQSTAASHIEEQEVQQQAMAAAQANYVALDQKVEQLSAQLDGQVTVTQLDSVVDHAVARAMDRITQTRIDADEHALAKVIARLDQQTVAINQLHSIYATIEQQPSRLEALLDKKFAAASASDGDADRLSAMASELKAGLSEPLAARLDEVLVHLKAQPSTEQLAATVAAVIGAEQDNITPLLQQLEQRLAHHPSSEKLAQTLRMVIDGQEDEVIPALSSLVARLEQQPSFDTFAQSIRDAIATQTQKLARQIDDLTARVDSQPSATQLAATMRAILESQPETLGTAIDELAAKLDNELTADQLARAGEMVDQAPAPDMRAELARIAEVVETLPAQYQAAQQAAADELRAAIRSELAAALEKVQLAMWPAADMEQTVSSSPAWTDAAVLLPDHTVANDAPFADLDGAATEQVPLAKPLSPTEEAYRLAYETNQPITLGGGVVNPMTQEVSAGRVLDPAVAKAAGITRWEDWYLMDDFAERMRLQKQVARYLSDTTRQVDVIRLPEQ
jgi:pSer/pThr/pTyr-binding forkhead associated (FHA) protein